MPAEQLEVTNPHDQALIESLPLADWVSAEAMLSRGRELADSRSRVIPLAERRAILRHAIELIGSNFRELVRLAVLEGGKPWTDSEIELRRAINSIEIAVEESGRLAGREVPMGLTAASAGRRAFTMREPIGLVLGLSAFNHPLNLIIHQVVPAFAAGCPVIIKPSSDTPLSCLRLVALLHEAGLPADWLQPIICSRDVAERMAADPRIDFLSFIGSAKVGWKLKAHLPHGARCSLEHGGAAPVVVEPDAPLDSMLPLLLKGGFYHSGQVCVSVQRVFVEGTALAQRVAERLAEGAEKLVVGDPLEAHTDCGPLIRPEDAERVEKWVAEAVGAGAKLLCGGRRISEGYYRPTVLLDPPDSAKVSQLEVFGPVVCVYTTKSRDESIARANSLPFAFQSAVFTKNISAALDCAERLAATAVMVNDHTAFRADWMPFGGYRESGYGMGGIIDSMHDMTREKMVVVKG